MTRLGLLAVLLVVWEVVGRAELIGGGALPAPTAIARAFASDSHSYAPHVHATVESAAWGFVFGNVLAVALAVLFMVAPLAEKMSQALMVTLFCVPIAVIAPILGLAYTGNHPNIILAAISVLFTTTVSTLVAMRSVPAGSLAVIHSSGGGRLTAMRLVQLRSGLPGLLGGLQIAAPAALLGSILGDFLGSEHGIGVYLTAVVRVGSPPRIWSLSLVTAALSAVGYGLFGYLRHRLTAASADVSVSDITPAASATSAARGRGALTATLTSLAGAAIILLLWWGFLLSTGLPRTVANSPLDVWKHLATGPKAGADRGLLRTALEQSIPSALLGVAVGLLVALALAVLCALVPRAASMLMPLAYLTQTIPLVAFAPLIALITGRGTATLVLVTVLVTFFPAFVAILQGITAAPAAPAQVLHSVAAGPWTLLRLYTVPQAMPYLLAAARLAVPRALLGVIIAEQLVTGTGIGGLLSRSRGFLDYSMMWSIAVCSVLVSIAAYLVVQLIEKRLLSRWVS